MQSDEQLIALLQKGQAEALDAIIDRYSGYTAAIINRVASGILSQSDLEEATADVFIALWQNADRITSGAKLKPYLAAIARNKARDRLRQQKNAACPLEEDALILSDSELSLEAAEQAECLRLAMTQMDTTDKTIFFWHYYFLEKITDIAEALDMNPSTVKSRLFRGRKYLRQVLKERGFDCATEDL